MQIVKKTIVIFIASFAMLLLIASVTSSTEYNFLFQFVGYFIFTVIAVKAFRKDSPSSTVLIVFVTMLLMQSYTIYLWFTESLSSFPFVVSYCLAIGSGLALVRIRSHFNVLPFFASCLLVLFMFFLGWDSLR